MYKFEFILLSLKILVLIFLTLNFQKITTLQKEKLLYYISVCLFPREDHLKSIFSYWSRQFYYYISKGTLVITHKKYKLNDYLPPKKIVQDHDDYDPAFSQI